MNWLFRERPRRCSPPTPRSSRLCRAQDAAMSSERWSKRCACRVFTCVGTAATRRLRSPSLISAVLRARAWPRRGPGSRDRPRVADRLASSESVEAQDHARPSRNERCHRSTRRLSLPGPPRMRRKLEYTRLLRAQKSGDTVGECEPWFTCVTHSFTLTKEAP